MDAKILIPAHSSVENTYSLNFTKIGDREASYGFDCDSEGNILIKPLKDREKNILPWLDNYMFCQSNIGKIFHKPQIVEHEHTTIEPAVAECGTCKERFLMYVSRLGTCRCPNCNQLYNAFGQELERE